MTGHGIKSMFSWLNGPPTNASLLLTFPTDFCTVGTGKAILLADQNGHVPVSPESVFWQ
jgi:hypothetical protein